MKNAWTLVGVSLCTACFLDREIGAGLEHGVLVTTNPGADPAPPRLPPPPRKQEGCCTVGARMALDPPDAQASRPSIAWNGTSWAVSWHARFGFLPAPTTPTDHIVPVIRVVEGDVPGALVELDERVMLPSAIAYHPTAAPGGGYVLTLASVAWPERDRHGRVVAVDRAGMRRASAAIQGISGGAALARVTALQAWAVLSHDSEAGGSGPAHLVLLDDNMAFLGSPVDLGTALQEEWLAVNVVALQEKIITLVPASDGVHIRTFIGRQLAEPEPGLVLDAGMAIDPSPSRGRDGKPLYPPTAVASVAAALVGEAVVIAAMNGENVRTWSYSPSTRSITDGPTVVGTSRHGGRLSIGGDSGGSSAGLCFSIGDGPGNPDGLQFVLVGPDGVPRGQPVAVASGLQYVAACDVAAGRTDEYLVAFWNAGGPGPPFGMFAARVQVQRPDPIIE